MNWIEIIVATFAAHSVLAAVLFAVCRSDRLTDRELNRLVVALVWPVTMPMIAGLWLWTRLRAVRLPRAKVVSKWR